MTWGISRGWTVLALSMSFACGETDEPGDSQGGSESGDTSADSEGATGSTQPTFDPVDTETAEEGSEGVAAEESGTDDTTVEDTGSEDTGPDLPPGYCYDADHGGSYPCECHEGDVQGCEDGEGVQVCIWFDEKVISGGYWSDCLECAPGTARECEAEGGAPGMQYCPDVDVHDRSLNEVAWGQCVDTTMLACDPIRGTGCAKGSCILDEFGVPYCG